MCIGYKGWLGRDSPLALLLSELLKCQPRKK
jgi:hypothetical protein